MHFLQRAIETNKFHVEMKKTHSHWLVHDSARSLKRSLGSVCEDLLIVHWYKTHPEKIESFNYAKDALMFIRDEKEKMQLGDVE